MKPSEFWTRVLALPEQARQAEQDASDLRISADALCEWAKLALDAQRIATALADDNDLDHASLILDSLAPRPDVSVANDTPPAESRPYVEKHVNVAQRRKRSDAGKPRARKGPVSPEDDPGPLANPADVKARDAARVSVAGRIRELLKQNDAPQTVAWIRANIDANVTSDDELRSALKLLSLVSWRMQWGGDSRPVEVWGTVEQFAEHVGRMSVKSGDRIADTVAKFGCSEFDAKRVWKELDPRVTS